MKIKSGDWRQHDKDYERERLKHPHPVPGRAYILKVLTEHSGPLTSDELAREIGLGPEDSLEAFAKRMQAMLREGQVVQNRRGAYGPARSMNVIKGTVSGHRDGFGWLIPADGGPDIFLNSRQMQQLLPGDVVLVRISGTNDRGKPEGTLVEVLERGIKTVVGRFQFKDGVCYVIPDNTKIQQDVLIPPEARAGATHGQMVVAELTAPPGNRTMPVGKIIEVLGEHLAPGMEIQAAIRTHNLPSEWPAEVLSEAAAIPDHVRHEDIVGRLDLRTLPLVTIDGEDARDFDDAVYAKPEKDGWTLWVAIADVAAYVKPGNPLDVEAANRGNSVYFPQQVIPMLPEKLSNGLCSLNPDVERLCMVCEMQVNKVGEVQRSRFHQAVMLSKARFTYNEVFAILENPNGPEAQKRAHLVGHLQALDALFHALFKARQARGAIDFDTVETKVVFDKDRKIEKIVPVFRNRAHRLIEECMIAANVEAAKFVGRGKLPTPFRTHAPPETEKIIALREFLQELGLKLGGGERPQALDYAKALERAQGRPDTSIVQSILLRSMMRACYSTQNIGHFGLALEEYAHFTSPIRRYPDLLLHRGIKHLLMRKPLETFEISASDMELYCARSSTTERRADEAVRDVMVWLKCEHMHEHIGETYTGVVTSVVGFGLFVELEGLYIEGLVHVSSLKNDYYQFEPKQHRLRGERSGKVYSMGQKLKVKLARVNLDERKIDLELLEGGGDAGPSRKGAGKQSPSHQKKGGFRRDGSGGRGKSKGRRR